MEKNSSYPCSSVLSVVKSLLLRDGLLNRNHPSHFRHFFAEVAFNPHLQGHCRRRTAMTRPVEADVDHAIGFDVDEFDVAAVGLDGRADEVDDVLHTLSHVRLLGLCRSGGHVRKV